MLGNEDNSSLWTNPIYSDAFKVNAGETKYITLLITVIWQVIGTISL